jgi:hypothetical protein
LSSDQLGRVPLENRHRQNVENLVAFFTRQLVDQFILLLVAVSGGVVGILVSLVD